MNMILLGLHYLLNAVFVNSYEYYRCIIAGVINTNTLPLHTHTHAHDTLTHIPPV